MIDTDKEIIFALYHGEHLASKELKRAEHLVYGLQQNLIRRIL